MSVEDEIKWLDDEIHRTKKKVENARTRVSSKKSQMAGWRRAGVDPEVNTDYSSSERQWEREYDILEEYENDAAETEAELAALIHQRKQLGGD